MPPDEGNTTEPTTEPTNQKTGATAGNSTSTFEGKSAEEWAKAYKGLQGSYQKLKTESDAEIENLKGQLSTAQTNIETLNQGGVSKDEQLKVLQSELAKQKESITTLQSEKESADALLQRKNLVLKDFPELAPFEAQGLLPSGKDDDELREQLEKFKGTLAGQVGATVKQTIAGSTPAGSGKTSPNQSAAQTIDGSEDHWWNVMVENAGPNGDPKKFSEAQDKYDAIQEAKGQS